MNDILHPSAETASEPGFPNAPEGWSKQQAQETAVGEGIEINDDHWHAVRGLQEYFSRHEEHDFNVRGLHDALGEKFHAQGGIRYLYQLFPGGPVAQGCRLAGLAPPAGATDKGFGSVQ